MGKLFSSKEIIRMLEQNEWEEIPRRGTSHRQFKHPTIKGRVTVSHPVRSFPIGTLRNIFRKAGWEWPP